MPRKKNYSASARRPKTCWHESPGGSSITAEPVQSAVDATGRAASSSESMPRSPDVDMVAILGPDADFTGSIRTVALASQLGRGIDEWVWATSESVKALLSAGASTKSAENWRNGMLTFYDFLVQGAVEAADGMQLLAPRPATPADLSPLHVAQFVAHLKKRRDEGGLAARTPRNYYTSTKTILLEMFSLGYIPGESHLFFPRGAFESAGESGTTSLSDAEQKRLATAIKRDLSAVHHGRLQVTMRELQALRLLVVAHRMGHNTTPLLKLARDAMRPGLVPGTVLVQTVKRRASKVTSQMGSGGSADGSGNPIEEDYLPFGLAEGAVIQLALASSEHLVARAPKRLRNRVWLYEVSRTAGAISKGEVSCIHDCTLGYSIKALIKRHGLLADDGQPLVVNVSRLRKSRFDRAFRLSDGDLAVTANLMGNTPEVAGTNYPSMNLARQAEAAGYMNEDYIGQMRSDEAQGAKIAKGAKGAKGASEGTALRVVSIKVASELGTATPVAGCADALGGEHAPKTGRPCDRFIMCLFCSSFAIVGTVDELWRLFSFQAFARVELAYLEDQLGPLPEGGEPSEELLDLRDRYRLAIPYIDTFTVKQFAASRVEQARVKAAAALHPFWVIQMQLSRRARAGAIADAEVATTPEGAVPHDKGLSYGT